MSGGHRLSSVEDEPVHSASISGASLASMINLLVESRGDFDGILFGHCSRRTLTTITDDSTLPATREERTAVITGFCSSGRLLSFYNAAGAVDQKRLSSHLSSREGSGDRIIGWLLGRRDSPLRPSMREAAVMHHLHAAEGSARLFLLLSSSISANAATHSFEYRAMQFCPSPRKVRGRSFMPTSLQVLNIGPEFRGHYDAFLPVSQFPYVPAPPASGGGETASSDWTVLLSPRKRLPEDADAHAQLARQAQGYSIDSLKMLASNARGTSEIEALFSRMLARLEELTKDVHASSAEVTRQMEENARLKSSVSRGDSFR